MAKVAPPPKSRKAIDERIAQIDWNSPTPPPGYKYGIDRGDYGFVTSAMNAASGKATLTSEQDVSMFDALDMIEEQRSLVKKQNAEKKRPRGAEIGGAALSGGVGGNGSTNGNGLEQMAKGLGTFSDAALDVLMSADNLDGLDGQLPTNRANPMFETEVAVDADAAPNMLRMRVMELAKNAQLQMDSSGRVVLNAEIEEMAKMGSDENPVSWISRARILKREGFEKRAVDTIMRGAELTKDKICFLEAIELESSDARKREIAERGTVVCPTSAELWERNAALQPLEMKKKAVLEDGVAACPDSDKLWALLIGMYPEEEHAELLRVARKSAPTSPTIWILLARAESRKTPINGRKILLEAIKRMPHAMELRLAAGKLECDLAAQLHNIQHTADDKLAVLMSQPRNSTLREAIRAVAAPAMLEGQLAISEVVALANEAATAEHCALMAVELLASVFVAAESTTWIEDSVTAIQEHLTETGFPSPSLTAACWLHITENAPLPPENQQVDPLPLHALDSLGYLIVAAKQAFTENASTVPLPLLLHRSVDAMGYDGHVRVMMAKQLYACGLMEDARKRLGEVLETPAAVPVNREGAIIGYAKAELLAGNSNEAAQVIVRGIRAAPSERLYVKLAMLHRETGNAASEEAVLAEAIAKFPTAEKPWMMRVQFAGRKCAAAGAANLQQLATLMEISNAALAAEHCRMSPRVWCSVARVFYTLVNQAERARARLEEGLRVLPPAATALLHQELAQLELEHGPAGSARGVVERAIAVGATHRTPILCASHIDLQVPVKRGKAAEAVTKQFKVKHGLVHCAIGRLFWGKATAGATENEQGGQRTLVSAAEATQLMQQALKAFRNAVRASPRCGDCHAALLRFCRETRGKSYAPHDLPQEDEAIVNAAEAAEPNEGPVWIRVTKEDIEVNRFSGPPVAWKALLDRAAASAEMLPR